MPIRYTGEGNLSEIILALFGDGISKSVVIDLSVAPFDLDFKGFFPTDLSVRSSGQPQESGVKLLSNGKIQIDYPEPLEIPMGAAQDKITIRLLYG
jgi:hypothetical protein